MVASITSFRQVFASIFCGLLFFSCLEANAQESAHDNKFSLSGQFRPRLEVRDGAFRPLASGEQPAALVSERLRLTIDYQYKDLLTVHISPQSVGVWGQSSMVQGAENSGNQLALFEAWASLKLGKHLSTKVGRQVISLDDERFFGELDWAQGARAHDAVSVHYKQSVVDVRAYFAFNQNYKTMYGNNLSNPAGNLYATNDAFPYKNMQTLWAGFQLSNASKLSFLANNLGLQQALPTTKDTCINYTQTFGLNFFHKSDNITGSLSGYFQTGKNLANVNTQAYMTAAYLGYNFTKNWQVGIGSDFVSGNDLGVKYKSNKAFNPFFHTGHKFYGNMDYYYCGNTHKGVGLSDNFLRMNFKSEQGLGIDVALHQFFTPNTITNMGVSYSKNLGQEVDILVTQKINKYASATGGYSFYVTTASTNYLKGVSPAKRIQNWFFISLNINPIFFKSFF